MLYFAKFAFGNMDVELRNGDTLLKDYMGHIPFRNV